MDVATIGLDRRDLAAPRFAGPVGENGIADRDATGRGAQRAGDLERVIGPKPAQVPFIFSSTLWCA
jgi:hypothetical protein